jgi:peptidase A4-like protein
MGRRARTVLVAAAAITLVSASSAWAGRSTSQAGYQGTQDTFQSVHATWVMPSISCPGQSSSEYQGEAWFGVAMGGSYSSSEQVVTRAFCTGTVPSYVAYFEVGGAQAAGAAGGVLTPRPGDRISATVSYLGVFPYAAGGVTYHVSRYRFAISDLTHRKSVTIVDSSDCVRYRCDHSAVEVTAGIPFARYSALADYGRVTFSGIRITDMRRHRGAFANNKHWKITKLVEFDAATHRLAAAPSRLRHRGTQVSVRWRGR